MTPSLIAAFTLGLLALLSLAANRRLAHVARLPMQWSWRGAVNWRAPRALALAFTPALAAIVLGSMLAAGPMRPGEAWIMGVMAAVFIAAHLLHLCLVLRQEKAHPHG